MPEKADLKDRLAAVRERIASAARRGGRRPEDIVLVAVTKYASMDQLRQLIELGHIDLGESRVQQLAHRVAQIEEFLQRHHQLSTGRSPDFPELVRWHMIGHLQRNKVRKVLPLVRLIHSVDSLRLAEEIQNAAAKYEEPVEVLVQVNTTGEKTKSGVVPAAVRHLTEQLDTMLNIRPRGLMCMAPFVEDPQDARPAFELCRDIFNEMRARGVGGEKFNILSMGMTNDFEVAIECGANIVRVGAAIFGPPAAPENAAD
ncbi:MAG: YggS family pyridoxal phosphate-dependent enzyme [Phycisphaerales bacterium]|nr:MAG: YggS family pyridoxal phosphate-dependent enzyme [Phycisphaerales bacterium]